MKKHPSLPVLSIVAAILTGAFGAAVARGVVISVSGFVPDLFVYLAYSTLVSTALCWWLPIYRRFCSRLALQYLEAFR